VFGVLVRIITCTFVETQPNLRLAALIPFIILGIGMPSSELGSHLAGLVRQIGFYAIVMSVYLLPRDKGVVMNLIPVRKQSVAQGLPPEGR